MKNINIEKAVQNAININSDKNEYRVVDGVAYLTVAEAATLLDIRADNTYRLFVRIGVNPVELFVSRGKVKHLLASDFVKMVQYYAKIGNVSAIKIAIATLELGMNTYIYSAAGVELPSFKPQTMTVQESLGQLAQFSLDQKKEHEAAINETNIRIDYLEDKFNSFNQPLTKIDDSEYFTISDCKMLMSTSTSPLALINIAKHYGIRIRKLGCFSYYHLDELEDAYVKAVKDSKPKGKVTYCHPAGFNFINR